VGFGALGNFPLPLKSPLQERQDTSTQPEEVVSMKKFLRCTVSIVTLLALSSLVLAQANAGHPGGLRYIEAGQPPVVIHPTIEAVQKSHHGGGSSNLYYHGGISDGAAGTVGVETAPKVYVVFWGSQWNSNDPSGEACILVGTAGCTSGSNANFLGNVGGSSWLGTVTQYLPRRLFRHLLL
jgi:hypothetical protein